MQEQIIRESSPNEVIAGLALDGFYRSSQFELREFWINFESLHSGLTDSPGPCITFGRVIDCIFELEKSAYKNFCAEVDKLATALGAQRNLDQHPGTKDAWEQWRNCHNSLIAAYELIRRDIRFGKLHRLRPSRWGNRIERNY